MTRIEEIEARLEKRQYIGSDFTEAVRDVTYLLAENKRLRAFAEKCADGDGFSLVNRARAPLTSEKVKP